MLDRELRLSSWGIRQPFTLWVLPIFQDLQNRRDVWKNQFHEIVSSWWSKCAVRILSPFNTSIFFHSTVKMIISPYPSIPLHNAVDLSSRELIFGNNSQNIHILITFWRRKSCFSINSGTSFLQILFFILDNLRVIFFPSSLALHPFFLTKDKHVSKEDQKEDKHIDLEF